MIQQVPLSIRYLAEDPVSIKDIIEGLQGVEFAINEAAGLLPLVFPNLHIQDVQVKVRELAQQSPLRELFLVSLIYVYQESFQKEFIENLEHISGRDVPNSIEQIFSILVLVVIFYGVGALKDFVDSKRTESAAAIQLDGLLTEVAQEIGKSVDEIREIVEARYVKPSRLKKLMKSVSRFFGPAKNYGNVGMEVNGREIAEDAIRDVPAEYLIEHESELRVAKNYSSALLRLHAQDRDRSGQGWAATVEGVADKRVKLKLMDEVNPSDLWHSDMVNGNITVLHEKTAFGLVPREIWLNSIKYLQ